jgi:rhodanese-related sulfurtransferase
MLKFLRSLFNNNPPDLIKQALEKGAVIIDVRTPAEFSQGHIKTSKNIPLNEIESQIPVIKAWGKPVITVCRTGSRSQIALNILKGAGIESYNGGAWTNLKNQVS